MKKPGPYPHVHSNPQQELLKMEEWRTLLNAKVGAVGHTSIYAAPLDT